MEIVSRLDRSRSVVGVDWLRIVIRNVKLRTGRYINGSALQGNSLFVRRMVVSEYIGISRVMGTWA